MRDGAPATLSSRCVVFKYTSRDQMPRNPGSCRPGGQHGGRVPSSQLLSVPVPATLPPLLGPAASHSRCLQPTVLLISSPAAAQPVHFREAPDRPLSPSAPHPTTCPSPPILHLPPPCLPLALLGSVHGLEGWWWPRVLSPGMHSSPLAMALLLRSGDAPWSLARFPPALPHRRSGPF